MTNITGSTRNRILLATVVATAALVAQPSAQAVPVLGANIYVQHDGDVVATFLGQTAGYDNELFLDSPYSSSRIFHNHLNSPGDSVNLGHFNAGTELIFRLSVLNTGNQFFNGAGSRNPDGIEHAIVDAGPSVTTVGFEDLFGGGDRDFDDTVFSFSNAGTVSHGVPDAGATLPLLTSGIAGLALLRRKLLKK